MDIGGKGARVVLGERDDWAPFQGQSSPDHGGVSAGGLGGAGGDLDRRGAQDGEGLVRLDAAQPVALDQSMQGVFAQAQRGL